MCEHGHVNRVVENGKGKEDGKRFKVETRDFFFFFLNTNMLKTSSPGKYRAFL